MNPTNVIPKENMTDDYQRWQLDSFDSSNTQGPSEPTNADRPDNNDSIVANNSTDLNTAKNNGPAQNNQQDKASHEKGYNAGFQSGRAAGYQEGKNQAESEIKDQLKRIEGMLSALDQELQQVDQQVAQDLLNLALGLAKQMITKTLQVRPELILPIVQEAIQQLPQTAQHPRLYLHPDDASLVNDHLGNELSRSEWKICADTQIARGGCKVVTEDNEIDASLQTRWQRIVAAIGQKDNWLAEE